ncbi:ABC transporter ATP-binding protein [Stomatohabitans albus]|uniref:ABC transporter ATP-binding protein n=1 Tax=Stomatohabitans albus TaxID=3110766 RepID=UPI00300D9202
MTEIALQATNLDCAIGKQVILNGINLEIPRGQMVALVGPNGAGKSTLLRTLAGIIPIPSGSVRIQGRALQRLSPRQRARRMAMVGQNEEPPADLTVAEVVALGLLPHRPPWTGGNASEYETVLAVLEQVQMRAYADRGFHQLSGGEQRRVLLARGIAQQTELLFLDEPTNHLDVRHQHTLLTMVRELGQTIVAAMHDLDLAALYFDQVVVVHEGRLVAMGTPEMVLSPERLREVFGISAAHVTDPITGDRRILFSYQSSDTTENSNPSTAPGGVL